MQRPVNQATGQLYRIVSGKIVIDVCQYGDIALDKEIALIVIMGVGRQSPEVPVGVVKDLEVRGEHVLSCVEG